MMLICQPINLSVCIQMIEIELSYNSLKIVKQKQNFVVDIASVFTSITVTNSEPCQISKMERLAEIVAKNC